MHVLLLLSLPVLLQTYRRIVRVDLKFPDKPAVSDGAKDFISKVGPPAVTLPLSCLSLFIHRHELGLVSWSA